jgi:predicted dehydrogenase
MRKIKWGVLSTAKIGIQKVIPAMQKATLCDVIAIASSNKEKVKKVATLLNIPKTYNSYEALLKDDEIEAVYIPLPNHLHVKWAKKAIKAGKHVLCEKPIGLNTNEAQTLLETAKTHPEILLSEAFMYKHHPQWVKAHQLVRDGEIGHLQTIQSYFSYYNVDPENIRNKPGMGGGGLMDIGCYCISLSRFIFNEEPLQVLGLMQYDNTFKTDYLTSGILNFENGHASFTCSTQSAPYQRVNILGTTGRIKIEIPFNAPYDKPCRIGLHHGDDTKEILFDKCNQYTIQDNLFSDAIINRKKLPYTIDDAVANMKVIDKIILSAKKGKFL